MNNSVRAIVYWFIGTALVSATALLIALYLVATIHGVQPETLHDLIRLWVSFTGIIASIPLFTICFGNADDALVRYFAQKGLRMILKWNGIAWVVWVGIFCWLAWQLEHKMNPPDDSDMAES